MGSMASLVRVTLGIATYNRDAYLADAIASGLAQDIDGLELVVVVDGSTNPKIDEVLARFADEPRLRVVRHPRNLGIAAAYNSFVSEGRGELVAMIGDDDLCLPGRIRRQVELFDRYPETGVVHGDAIVIDSAGKQTGVWNSAELTPAALLQSFFFSHNHLIDPTRMVHRRVYEQVGGYDDRYPVANDLDFWLRACRAFRFRHTPGGPVSAIRRHGDNASDERSGRTAELADVEAILAAALERCPLRELVPALDWAVLESDDAQRQALERLADGLERRLLPVPGLAAKLRARAAELSMLRQRPARRPDAKGKLLVTAFGFNDAGGGTTVPRLAAKELARRGWDVTVFHAATALTGTGIPYELREWDEDGVHLIGVHNRLHGLFDLGNPLRELDDPPITVAFAAVLDRIRPDVVHFHNLHNLGAALIDEAAVRGVPSYFTTHNYWLICPRAYLLTGEGSICPGPRGGADCASCTGGNDEAGHRRRLTEISARAHAGLTAVLSVSHAVRRTLLGSGYAPELVDVVRQAMPHDTEIWEQVGRDRIPGARRPRLTVAFLGSAYPHKGPQLLVQAAQQTGAELDVRILGEVPATFAEHLRSLDRRGVVELSGAFAPSEIGGLLRDVDAVVLPSLWWDCAPLAAAECLAARVPLIVPRLGGLAEAVRDGVDGLVFDALDADDLARVLDRLAGEPGLLERLQAAIEPPRAFADYVDELEAYYTGERPGRVDGPLAPIDIAVRWQGDHELSTSLSIINDEVSARLPGPVAQVALDGSNDGPPLPHAATVEVRHQWPPDLRPPASGALAAIVPWEFGAIPRDWVGPIKANVDELWVPSEHVRQMYLSAGIDPGRVQVIPNGVDLDVFHPLASPEDRDGERQGAGTTRFLFVGGLIRRKGPDVLLDAWRRAFPDRDDVVLVIKDFGADTVYRRADRGPIREYAESGALPRVELIQADLDTAALADLYRSCDVLVHPYRGEGFAMPVLEAMACGVPVITTAGGPTDEFCPAGAGWRIRSTRVAFPDDQVGWLRTAGRPWVLEPDGDHLVHLLRDADEKPGERRARGRVARAAAETLSWDDVAARYADRIAMLGARRPRLAAGSGAAFPFEEDADLRVLATPAWRGADDLASLLDEWCDATTRSSRACLYLLADPAAAGEPEQIERFVLEAAARSGADLEACADINVLLEPMRADRDARLHASVDAYVPLHQACAGHIRLARGANSAVVSVGSGELATLLAARLNPLIEVSIS
jgi:glycosyltransferase involved in cell wall biosynthesis